MPTPRKSLKELSDMAFDAEQQADSVLALVTVLADGDRDDDIQGTFLALARLIESVSDQLSAIVEAFYNHVQPTAQEVQS